MAIGPQRGNWRVALDGSATRQQPPIPIREWAPLSQRKVLQKHQLLQPNLWNESSQHVNIPNSTAGGVPLLRIWNAVTGRGCIAVTIGLWVPCFITHPAISSNQGMIKNGYIPTCQRWKATNGRPSLFVEQRYSRIDCRLLCLDIGDVSRRLRGAFAG